MDRLEFLLRYLQIHATFLTTSLTAFLSWPVAFVAAVFVFKQPVQALIGRIRRVTTPAGDVHLDDLKQSAGGGGGGAAGGGLGLARRRWRWRYAWGSPPLPVAYSEAQAEALR